MTRPPPRATLFPYTTLFRSARLTRAGMLEVLRSDYIRTARGCSRSEEHTSELQTLRHLVCRPLLEKKKNPVLAVTMFRCKRDYFQATRRGLHGEHCIMVLSP